MIDETHYTEPLVKGIYQKPAAYQAMLDTLRDNKEFTFYLTGSRYFMTAQSSSDWDFFTQNDVKTKAWLESLGFKNHVESHYIIDGNTDSVWRYVTSYKLELQPGSMYAKAGLLTNKFVMENDIGEAQYHIDVVFVHDVKRRVIVQKLLEKERILHTVPKQYRRAVYRWLDLVIEEFSD